MKDEQAQKEIQQAQDLMRKLKKITKEALLQSNSCSHVTTAEWVRVRIIAAKTYLLEKKFNKALAILTDLCYLIPPDMLKIEGGGNIISMYDNDKNVFSGGIRFCDQVLLDDVEDDYGLEDYGDEDDSNLE